MVYLVDCRLWFTLWTVIDSGVLRKCYVAANSKLQLVALKQNSSYFGVIVLFKMKTPDQCSCVYVVCVRLPRGR